MLEAEFSKTSYTVPYFLTDFEGRPERYNENDKNSIRTVLISNICRTLLKFLNIGKRSREEASYNIGTKYRIVAAE